MDPKVIFLMGPTASGKTSLAIDLYKSIPSELISVDSALIYKGMDIGTAKPTAAELLDAPHHLIDILDPASAYSAADFRTDALRLIADIHSRGKTAILVGGTMLYFRTLLQGISPLPEAHHPGIFHQSGILRYRLARGAFHIFLFQSLYIHLW